VIKITLHEAASIAGGTLYGAADPQTRIRGVSIDSRSLQPGNLFIPIIGERFDGHDFVPDSFRAQASAALWQADRGQPPEAGPVIIVDNTTSALQKLAAAYRRRLRTRVIGITGSNGKTTTKDMTAAVLASTFKVHKTTGNLNNHWGLPLTLLRMPEDTEFAVVEMGMSGRGEIAALSAIARPDAAVITNIGEAHLLQLGSREAIASAKLEIAAGLADDGLLVYRGDEPLLEKALREIDRAGGKSGLKAPAHRLRFGESDANDLYPTAILMDADGTRFTLNGMPDRPLQIPMWGRHNVVNAIAAAAIARHYGVPWEGIRGGLAELKPTGMRADIVRTEDGVTLLDETYNASPTAMRAALSLLADLQGFKRKIAVLGDMLELGENEAAFHAEIGRELNPNEIHRVLTYGRLGAQIGRAAGERYPTGHVLIFQEKEALVQALQQLASEGDLILVKGSRGMRMEEVVKAFLSGR
jgi:UDP-N-acetylmuramoyl-tripeptide--D-alanyl-D-alanine ligase